MGESGDVAFPNVFEGGSLIDRLVCAHSGILEVASKKKSDHFVSTTLPMCVILHRTDSYPALRLTVLCIILSLSIPPTRLLGETQSHVTKRPASYLHRAQTCHDLLIVFPLCFGRSHHDPQSLSRGVCLDVFNVDFGSALRARFRSGRLTTV
jgi:hypothetical protein